jgi:hypothetical protein
MPLRDHFRPPVDELLPWDTLHAGWVSALAVHLNTRWLVDDEFVALEESRPGDETVVDIATYQQPFGSSDGGVATRMLTYSPAPARTSVETVLPDHHEIRILRQRGGRHLVAAIELISPANKDRPATREAFVAKCLAYLQAGVCVVILDVVTSDSHNLHALICESLRADAEIAVPASELYAATYRPVLRDGRAEMDIWASNCRVGEVLPTMPLRLVGDRFIPVEFEVTYTDVCRNRKLV